MRRCGTAALLAAALAAVVACGERPPEAPGGSTAARGPVAEIDWFEGSVEEAFAAARAASRPLFLYWGAEWCPPCHYLKTKIFSRPEFVARSRQFVAVYLDGDTARAQSWGETFGTVGYPTVILFDPDGREVLRMSSGIPIEEYIGVLDAALARMRPVGELLSEVLASGPARASAADLELLAFHSWDQDGETDLPDAERAAVFRTLWQGTPKRLAVERSRFLVLFLDATAGAGEAAELTPEDSALLHGAVLRLLGDRDQRNANLFFVSFRAAETVELLHPLPSPRRRQLIAAWEAAAQDLEEDPGLAVADRLAALNSRIEISRLTSAMVPGEEPPPLPDALAAHLRDRIAWAAGLVRDGGELQAVMNTMAHLLVDAGLTAEAEALIVERMDQTVAPHYFMSWLGDLEREGGRSAEALDWFRRAYDAARGPHTRFQWGASYLAEIMALAPQDAALLEAASLEILDELLTQEDAFANRNRTRLARLEDVYRSWGDGGERIAVVGRIRDFVHAACDRFPDGGEDSPRDRCASFLADLDKSEPAA